MRRNTVIGAVALTLATTVLSACGGGGGGSSSGASGDYCSDLKADKTYFESFNGSNPDLSKLDEVFSRMHTLAGEAPSEVSSDWKTLDGALTTLENALKEAGIKPSDLAQMQNGQVPKGVDIQKLQALAPKLQSLSSSDVSAAGDAITKDAKDKCGIDLNAS
jgi:hypothetical protein